jgi:hypoxia-inducible factor (prolyl hydroxylase)
MASVTGLTSLERGTHGRSQWTFVAALPEFECPQCLQEQQAIHAASQDSLYWWQSQGATGIIAEQLSSRGFCLLDQFLGSEDCAQLAAEVRAAYNAGRLQSPYGSLHRQRQSSGSDRDRGDQIGWFDGSEPCWRVLPTLLLLINRLVTLVRMSEQAPADLLGASKRSRAMVACYPGDGTQYVKHCDNICTDGHGTACNGRRLTAILYLNLLWRPGDGGELVIYPPDADGGRCGETGPPALGLVAPRANRLVLFYADRRVPHEVLPSTTERFAVTQWFFDAEEAQRALRGCA